MTQPYMSDAERELGKKLFKILQSAVGSLNHTHIGYASDHDYMLDPFIDDVIALIKSREQQVAKAYGGCTNCYGKGYATTIDYSSGVDTDQDIGSPGGTVRFKNPTMRYCSCERGKQLERAVQQVAVEADLRGSIEAAGQIWAVYNAKRNGEQIFDFEAWLPTQIQDWKAKLQARHKGDKYT